VRLYAFDLLMDDEVDMRDEPLRVRKLWRERLLKKPGPGILLNQHECGVIGHIFSSTPANSAWRAS
jgi:ATP-dependent DNA ligase